MIEGQDYYFLIHSSNPGGKLPPYHATAIHCKSSIENYGVGESEALAKERALDNLKDSVLRYYDKLIDKHKISRWEEV